MIIGNALFMTKLYKCYQLLEIVLHCKPLGFDSESTQILDYKIITAK